MWHGHVPPDRQSALILSLQQFQQLFPKVVDHGSLGKHAGKQLRQDATDYIIGFCTCVQKLDEQTRAKTAYSKADTSRKFCK